MSMTQFDRRVPLDKATSSAPYTQHYHKVTNVLRTRSFILAGAKFKEESDYPLALYETQTDS